jgi:3-phenylpropionate/trans-cinnamate dioxygenase ferredoxin reductase subunit
MPSSTTFVIVGGGLAGARAASTLREEGYDGRLLLVAAEPEWPYERPPLSKDYLRGESPREAARVHPPELYAERDIELRTGTAVVALDPRAATLHLSDGEAVHYDRLLLATGAEPRRLPIPGADLDGVLVLRSLHDADGLRARLKGAGRLVVVGAGWIGSEVAASARQLGMEVALVDHVSAPLERVLGARMGAFFGDVHRGHGVELALGTGVASFEGTGSVEAVLTTDGRRLECDTALVGVGVTPAVGLARQAGIAVDDGIVVDAGLRTSAPDVFAAGDVASSHHPLYGRHIRVEHWANALHQGPAAARSMLGLKVVYDRVPYFFSDQYDVGMEYSGLADTTDELVIRGDIDSGEFIAFWLRDDRVTAGMNVNVWDVAEDIQALIRSQEPIDPARLTDAGTPLDQALTTATPT